MDSILTISIAIVTFGVLVTFHEFGHFWVARRCGVKVLRFAVGFGPVLARRTDRCGTEFALCALPLGGYVRMVDEREGPVAADDLPYAFNNKSVGRRTAIVAAGPAANFLLAVLAYWIMFMSGITGLAPVVGEVRPGSPAAAAGLQAGDEIVAVDGEATPSWREVNMELLGYLGETGSIGLLVRPAGGTTEYPLQLQVQDWLQGEVEPDLLDSLGIDQYRPAVRPALAEVVAGSAADRAGLKPGDILVSVDGVALRDWGQWVDYVRTRPGEAIQLEYFREGRAQRTVITPLAQAEPGGETIGFVGTRVVLPEYPPEMLRQSTFGPVAALGQALGETWRISLFTLESVKKLIEGLISPKNLSGPITIAKVASDSARVGLESWLGVLALLSISLGVLNLLPVPVLDGGHILFYLIEWVKGSPVSERAQLLGFRIGLSIVMCLMALAIYNDISRL